VNRIFQIYKILRLEKIIDNNLKNIYKAIENMPPEEALEIIKINALGNENITYYSKCLGLQKNYFGEILDHLRKYEDKGIIQRADAIRYFGYIVGPKNLSDDAAEFRKK
jgi:hypothetical protein